MCIALGSCERAVARMQGNCEGALWPKWLVESPPTVPLARGQCYVRTPFQIFFWGEQHISSIWLHNLQMVMAPSLISAPQLIYWVPQPTSRMWLTNSVLEGVVDGSTRGIFIGNSLVYIGGAHVPSASCQSLECVQSAHANAACSQSCQWPLQATHPMSRHTP
jgi:hypothetical protein